MSDTEIMIASDAFEKNIHTELGLYRGQVSYTTMNISKLTNGHKYLSLDANGVSVAIELTDQDCSHINQLLQA